MRLRLTTVLSCTMTAAMCIALADAARAETVTVYRDDWGVPHIYAESLPGAAYGAGYAQAEDRLEQMLQNYRLAAGNLAEVAGPSLVDQDYRSRVWQHEEVARDHYERMDPRLKATCTAFIRGVQKYMDEHPADVPKWAQKLEPHFPVMLSRFIIWNWPEGQAAGDLERAGIKPSPQPYLGSNEWVIAANRSATGNVIALIDPHLSWYGPFRFYEQRMYARGEDFALSGAAILGLPMPGLGHTQYASVAMTTGGPDTADVYEETVDPANPLRYEVDGKWREMKTRKITIRVRDGEKIIEKHFQLDSTHHGPVVARKDNKAYTMALAYIDCAGLMEELYKVHTARNMDQIKAALSTCELMPQNIMIGTVDGDTFYVHDGRVPVRNHGLPTNRPVPGNVSKNDFAGIHPFEDLPQVTNPKAGYMQNCNVAPAVMMRGSPMTKESAKRPYLYYDDGRGNHQRAEMVTEILHTDNSVTLEEAIDLAFCTQVLGAEKWQDRIAQAWQTASADAKTPDVQAVVANIRDWNRRSDPGSKGAIAYYAFKQALGGKTSEAVAVPAELSDADIVAALAKGAEWLRSKVGGVDARYGDVFRVARKDGKQSWPVGGGSLKEAGMATPRAISFGNVGEQKIGHGGQTSTQIVVLSKPPRSYMVLPLGESDHPETGHWDDQAAKLFSEGKAKDTYFMDLDALKPHVTSTATLAFE
ncbi:MAG TPA: penicillin acylase family protein [Pirellulales bacterium]|nr:penicillin acylase family protein [Pirellulales bacterium]